jgi:hypothetical protein
MKSTMTLILAAITMMATLTGCATQATIKDVAEAHAKLDRPTMTIKCAAGCEATFTDPRDRPQLTMPTNGWDVAKSVVQTGGAVITQAAPWAAVGAIAVRGIKGAGGNDQSTTTTTTDNSSIDSHDATAEPTIVTQPAPAIITQPAPTIVTQPAPVVVQQPAPLVVNPVVVTP